MLLSCLYLVVFMFICLIDNCLLCLWLLSLYFCDYYFLRYEKKIFVSIYFFFLDLGFISFAANYFFGLSIYPLVLCIPVVSAFHISTSISFAYVLINSQHPYLLSVSYINITFYIHTAPYRSINTGYVNQQINNGNGKILLLRKENKNKNGINNINNQQKGDKTPV